MLTLTKLKSRIPCNILTVLAKTREGIACSATVTYTYDDLNRMLSATATNVASGQSTYTQNFTYNAIGNITAGPVGSYTYAGTGYANPHAATSINSVTNTYDKDGNNLTDGTLTNTWNYKDQLSTSTNGTFTRTYLYDQDGNRVSSDDGTIVTVYPNKYYTYDGTTKTKDIYAGDTLVATVTEVGSTVTPYYVHTDHLGSTNVTSDSSGAQVDLYDYFPYGNTRISTGSPSNGRQFLGQKFDSDTAYSYLQARYLQSSTGRFISEDPQFWNFDNSWLADPQNQNSYSYSRGNPITLSDPNGRSAAGAPMGPWGIALMMLFAPTPTSYDPVYESAQYQAQNSPANQSINMTMGWMTSGLGGEGNIVNNTLVKNSAGELSNVYRGGEIKFNLATDFRKTFNAEKGIIDPSLSASRPEGISVNTNPLNKDVVRYGGANKITSLPKGLNIVQSGQADHYVIQPNAKMTVEKFSSLVNKMVDRISSKAKNN